MKRLGKLESLFTYELFHIAGICYSDNNLSTEADVINTP